MLKLLVEFNCPAADPVASAAIDPVAARVVPNPARVVCFRNSLREFDMVDELIGRKGRGDA